MEVRPNSSAMALVLGKVGKHSAKERSRCGRGEAELQKQLVACRPGVMFRFGTRTELTLSSFGPTPAFH